MNARVKQLRQRLLKNSLRINVFALVVIIFVVLLGNIVFVSGLRDANPLLQYSGLATSTSGKIFQGAYTIDTNIAYTTQALGAAAAHQILQGHMPYWNYYEGMGTPLAGEMQSAAFFPPTLFLIFQGGLLFEHMLLEVVAGFFTYLLIRRLGLQARVALLAGIMFALNGTFAWIANAAFNPIAFLPVMLYGVEAVFLSDKKSRTWLWLPVGLALSLYAGFPETAFIDGLLVGLWTAARLWQKRRDINRRQIGRICVGFIVGVLLAMPILVSFADYLLNADVSQHADVFAHASLHLMSLPVHVFPYVYGTIGNAIPAAATWDGIGGYISITVFFLAIVGLFAPINKTLRVVAALWIAACFLKAFGFRPAEDIWNLIPTIKNAAFFRYCTPSVYFACTILASFGMQSILTKTIGKKRLIYAYITFAIVFICLIVLVGHYWNLLAAVPGHKYFAVVGSIWWASMIILLLAGTIAFVKDKYVYAGIFLFVLADVLFMFVIPTLSTPKVTADTAPITFLQKNLGTSRFYTLGPIQANYGSYFGIQEVNSNDLPVPSLWAKYLTKNLDRNTDPVTFTGDYRSDANGPSAFSEFLRNEKNFEYIGTKYLVVGHDGLTSDQITQAGLDLKYSNSTLDIYQLPYTEPYYQASDGCTIKDSSLDSVKVHCKTSGTLIRKELYMPGWSVDINGKHGEVRKHADLFQVVDLPMGESSLTFTFAPPYIVEAWIAFIVGLLVVFYELLPHRVFVHVNNLKSRLYNQSWIKR